MLEVQQQQPEQILKAIYKQLERKEKNSISYTLKNRIMSLNYSSISKN